MSYESEPEVRPSLRSLPARIARPKRIVTYPAAFGFVLLGVPIGVLVERILPSTNVPLVFLGAVLAAAVFGGVGARLRRQLDLSRIAAERAAVLQAFGRRAAAATTQRETGEIIVDVVARAMSSGAALLEPDAAGVFRIVAAQPPLNGMDDDLRAGAAWACVQRESAGWSTSRHPDLGWMLIPLAKAPVALLAIARRPGGAALTKPERLLVDALADQALSVLDRARLVEENAEAQRFRETERLRSALLSSVSHDLRTPLASIVGAATTLQSLGDRLSADNRFSLADTIAGEAQRLNRYIQNLLDMTKLDHGALRAEAEWVDLRDVAAAARARLRDALGARKVDQSIPEDVAFVLADPVLLEQILVNILDNAVKFGGPQGAVHIAADAREGAIVLSVADEGPGIDLGDRERIFEPFHTAGDRGAGGTGLGLSIARGFARAMGGDVLARNAPSGRGARFDIVLPRTQHPTFDLEKSGAPAPTVNDDAA